MTLPQCCSGGALNTIQVTVKSGLDPNERISENTNEDKTQTNKQATMMTELIELFTETYIEL